jgi:hypothetical protein
MGDFFKIIVGFFGLLVLLVVLIVSFDKNQLKQSCKIFGQTSGYETRYFEFTYWSYDCQARQENGKWISTTLLRENSK